MLLAERISLRHRGLVDIGEERSQPLDGIAGLSEQLGDGDRVV